MPGPPGPALVRVRHARRAHALLGIDREEAHRDPGHEPACGADAPRLRGSSYLKLPRALQFFMGNIGLHHVHHLNARIPNYNLQRAHDENAVFHQVPTLSSRDGLHSVRLKPWVRRARKALHVRTGAGQAALRRRRSATEWETAEGVLAGV
jgi:fatty acid desaturase